VRAELLIDVAAAAVEVPFRVGVLFELDRGWHLYWRNPGDAGLPTELRWEIEAADLGPIAWPAPTVFREGDGALTTYGYAGSVLLAQPAHLRPGPDRRPVRVTAEFLVCKVQCIPGRIELERELPVASVASPDAAARERFDEFAERLPRPASSEPDLELEVFYSRTAVRPGDEFRAALAISPHTLGTARAEQAFAPDAPPPGVVLAVTGRRPHPFAERGVLLTLSGRADGRDPGRNERLRGVLALRDPEGRPRAIEVDVAFPRAPAGAAVETIDDAWLHPAPEPAADVGLAQAVGLGLLGGLILNLMPCVLPVLAIKAFGMTELARAGRRERLAQGLAYSAGVIVSLLGLASLVAALRALGTEVGWGFQFQEPLFVAGISALLVVFALNLFGAFELSVDVSRLARAGESASGARRSFLEGLLAVALATPCSAPFLGTAVGFAFASSTPLIFAIFASIGVGLAAPYVVLLAVPAAARWIPRSGAWTLHLRSALGFALLGTVAWLLWVFGRQSGVEGMAALLAFLLAVALLAWLYGVLQAAGRPRGALALVLLGLGLLGLGLARIPFGGVGGAEPTHASVSPLAAQPFDRESLRVALAAGRPVFLYFTADWCLTCKVTERWVFTDERVQRELRARGVAVFEADWTRRDESIRAELAALGKAGVPVYVLYTPGAPETPRVLPDLLTRDLLVAALREVAIATPDQGGR
jgi:thiol:disulfide interchange protein DsbD